MQLFRYPRSLKKQRRLVEKACVNLGHPHHDQLMRVLQVAKALPQVIKYARDFLIVQTVRLAENRVQLDEVQCRGDVSSKEFSRSTRLR